MAIAPSSERSIANSRDPSLTTVIFRRGDPPPSQKYAGWLYSIDSRYKDQEKEVRYEDG